MILSYKIKSFYIFLNINSLQIDVAKDEGSHKEFPSSCCNPSIVNHSASSISQYALFGWLLQS